MSLGPKLTSGSFGFPRYTTDEPSLFAPETFLKSELKVLPGIELVLTQALLGFSLQPTVKMPVDKINADKITSALVFDETIFLSSGKNTVKHNF